MLPRTLESSILDGDLRIGDFVVRPLLKVVRPAAADAAAEETTLPDKAMAVLVYLAQNSRQVCDRDDILDAVWGPEREAYDRVLDNAIREIRRALDDDARNPTYIQTIPKKGYRLLVPVESRLLEKQRDSSGEFVPVVRDAVGRDSAQVFQRVRRGTRPDVRAETRSGFESRLPGESPGRPHGTRPRVRLVLATVAVLLLLVTVTAWWSGVFGSDRVTVAIDTESLDSLTANSGPVPTSLATDLTEALQNALFEEHACAHQALYRRDTWLRSADFRVRFRLSEVLSAEIEPGDRRAALHFEDDHAAAATALAAAVTEQLDQAVCRLERLPDESRACHCLEGSRRWASLPDSQASVDDLRLAITLDPDLAPAYAELAEAFRLGGNSGEGMAVLKSGLAKVEDPDSSEALELRLQLARLLGDPAEEGRLLEELRQREPDEPKWRLKQAAFLNSHQRRCAESLEILGPLLAQEHRHAVVTVEASRAMWFCGQRERAFELVAEQVEGQPRNADLHGFLAIVLSLAGQYDEAASYATESMALEPEASEPFWILGLVSERQGHYASAKAWYERSVELARWPKQHARAQVGLARIARLRGDQALCVEIADQVPEPAVETYESPSLLKGLCLVESGRIADARAALAEFTSTVASQFSQAHRATRLLLQAKVEMAEAGTPDQRRHAKALLVEAASSHPVRADMLHFEVGTALLESGDSGEAESWFGRALAANPKHPWSLCRLGMLQLERGERDAAAESMRRGLEVFGPRLEDPLAVRCVDALGELDPTWAESAQIQVVTLP